MGLSATDERATLIVSMITQGSKDIGQLAVGSSKPEQVLMAAAGMRDNRSAINRYAAETGCSYEQAFKALDIAKDSAQLLALEHGFTTLLQSSWFE